MRAKKVSTDAGKSSRQSDHNLTQVSLTCSHTAALVPVPTSRVNCTASSCSRRVHLRAGCPGCWLAVARTAATSADMQYRCALTSKHAPTSHPPSAPPPLRTARTFSGDVVALH